MGKRATAFRLVWVGADATDNAALGSSTVYGFVHDAFDLARLDGLKPAQLGAAPVSNVNFAGYMAGAVVPKPRLMLQSVWTAVLAP